MVPKRERIAPVGQGILPVRLRSAPVRQRIAPTGLDMRS